MEARGDVARSFLTADLLPWNRWAFARNNAIMEKELLPDVEKTMNAGGSGSKKTTLLNQALKEIEQQTGQKALTVSSLDKASYRSIMSNLKILLLAGFETTSGLICWIFKELQDNPEWMQKIRAEHDEILGPDPNQAAQVLKKSPQLLNSLPYTHAVVKEVLRMYPLTFAIRQGTPGKSQQVWYLQSSWVVFWNAVNMISPSQITFSPCRARP